MILNVLLKSIGNRWLYYSPSRNLLSRGMETSSFSIYCTTRAIGLRTDMLVIIQVYEALRIRRNSCSDTAEFTWFHLEYR